MADAMDIPSRSTARAIRQGREFFRWLLNAILVGAGVVLVLSAAVLLLTQLAQAAPAKPVPTTTCSARPAEIRWIRAGRISVMGDRVQREQLVIIEHVEHQLSPQPGQGRLSGLLPLAHRRRDAAAGSPPPARHL